MGVRDIFEYTARNSEDQFLYAFQILAAIVPMESEGMTLGISSLVVKLSTVTLYAEVGPQIAERSHLLGYICRVRSYQEARSPSRECSRGTDICKGF